MLTSGAQKSIQARSYAASGSFLRHLALTSLVDVVLVELLLLLLLANGVQDAAEQAHVARVAGVVRGEFCGPAEIVVVVVAVSVTLEQMIWNKSVDCSSFLAFSFMAKRVILPGFVKARSPCKRNGIVGPSGAHVHRNTCKATI